MVQESWSITNTDAYKSLPPEEVQVMWSTELPEMRDENPVRYNFFCQMQDMRLFLYLTVCVCSFAGPMGRNHRIF